MLYIIDHYYAVNNAEYCLVVESNKSAEDIVEICSAITFLLEDLTDSGVSLSMDCLLKILETYYGVKNKKASVSKKELQTILPVREFVKVAKVRVDNIIPLMPNAFAIDLYEAREHCCGEKSVRIMNNWLPTGEQRKELEKLLLEEGIEE